MTRRFVFFVAGWLARRPYQTRVPTGVFTPPGHGAAKYTGRDSTRKESACSFCSLFADHPLEAHLELVL